MSQAYVLSTDTLPECKSGDLSLKIENSNFLKNNEYFNNIVEGYTLMGFWATPTLQYQITENSAIEGGVHVLKFAGRDDFFKTLPVVRFTQQISPSLAMILGTVKNNANHLMPAPMYDPERFYFNQADNGAQFLFSKNWCKADLWLSWDNFIFYGDSVQERITSGFSSKFQWDVKENIRFRFPLHLMITHKGGQINRPKMPIQTVNNLCSGIEMETDLDNFWLNRITFSPRYFFFSKNSGDTLLPYKNGWALEPTISLNFRWFVLESSYWYSNKFISTRGEAIYQPISSVINGYKEKSRKLIVNKLKYFYQLPKHITISAGFEGYYDMHEKIFDYNYSLQINCILDWRLGNFAIRE
jgi:hypothetical protein